MNYFSKLDEGATSTTGATVLLSAGGILIAGALAIPLLGFGAAGVAGGSTAARIQSNVYGSATAGLFSVLQSIGATMAWAPLATVGVALCAIAWAVL